MKTLIAEWKSDKLAGSLELCFLASLAASFLGGEILSFELPAIGTITLFRVFLALAAVLYLIWAVREKDFFWKNADTIEKWCYLLIVIMLVYSAVSLFRAIDFMYTFRMLFNLCFDLCFFFLTLRLCRDEKLFRRALYVCAVMVTLLCVAGIYEIFCGGIFNPGYDDIKRFMWFNECYQFPLVTYLNPNNYNAALDMCGAVLLLALCKRDGTLKNRKIALAAVLICALYFLAKASTARLSLVAVLVIFVGFAVFLLIGDKRRLWAAALCLVFMLTIQFINQYRYIVPPIRQYLAEMEEYKQNPLPPDTPQPENPDTPDTPQPENPNTPDTPQPEKPSLNLGDPNKVTLENEFFEVDETTGEKKLRSEDSSGGQRSLLLLHAFHCFKESHGFGVGLGNTAQLAKIREVTPEARIWDIHCFVARIIADYGVFVLIPLCAVAILLLKRVWALLLAGLKTHDRQAAAYAALFFFMLLTYPLTSTAPSDAQDVIAMWFYLASVMLFSGSLIKENTSIECFTD